MKLCARCGTRKQVWFWVSGWGFLCFPCKWTLEQLFGPTARSGLRILVSAFCLAAPSWTWAW